MANILEKIIGSGVLYPIKLEQNSSGQTGWYPVTGNPDLILHNINSVIQYEIGSRIRQEDFGTRLLECIEEPNSQAQAFLVNQFVKQAMVTWEDRIYLTKTELVRQGTKLSVIIHYTLKNTNFSDAISATYET
jgi:phage baseplate assembly protein W